MPLSDKMPRIVICVACGSISSEMWYCGSHGTICQKCADTLPPDSAHRFDIKLFSPSSSPPMDDKQLIDSLADALSKRMVYPPPTERELELLAEAEERIFAERPLKERLEELAANWGMRPKG